ncbi:hypothetical protein ACSVIJ_05135 [Pseudomonas sp. NCHU5208]|uniref:hypothetical protein n=1 Tax=unclassified Pseudomonas TaxID=196821 RepID=UPI003F993396
MPDVAPQRRQRFTWTAEALALLGTVTDRTVAQRFDILRTSVANKRVELGIPAFVSQQRPDKCHVWKPAELKQLGTKSDTDLAAELGLGITAVRNKRMSLGIQTFEKWGSVAALLGVIPDTEINAIHGVPLSTLVRMRKARDVASVGKAGRPTVPLPDQAQQLLGKVSDVEIAKRFQVPLKRVSKARQRAGIDAFAVKA